MYAILAVLTPRITHISLETVPQFDLTSFSTRSPAQTQSGDDEGVVGKTYTAGTNKRIV